MAVWRFGPLLARRRSLEPLRIGQPRRINGCETTRETSEIPDLAVNRLAAPVLQQIIVQVDAVKGGAGGMGFVEIREVLVNEMWQWFG